jgi:hypothetical protein
VVHHHSDTDALGFPVFMLNSDRVDTEVKRLKAMGYEV